MGQFSNTTKILKNLDSLFSSIPRDMPKCRAMWRMVHLSLNHAPTQYHTYAYYVGTTAMMLPAL
eukprot:scaffold225831_cov20-Cyclotella_meneghiniana.AAC.1